MVLERSQFMQTSTVPVLDLIHKHLAVTLDETLDVTESVSTKLEIILGKLQRNTDKGSNVSLDRTAGLDSSFVNESYVFCESLLQSSSMGKDSDACDWSQVLSDSIPINQPPTMSAETLNHSNFGLTHPEFSSLDDIETDGAACSGIIHVPAVFDLLDRTNSLTLERATSSSSFSSSSDDEGLYDDSLSTDPRYVKKFEQALKLGYSEQNVVKVLRELGPECGLNDLLSELMKLGASDPDLLLSHMPSQEADLVDCDGSNVVSSYSTTLSGSTSIPESNFISSHLGNSSTSADTGSNLHYIIIDGSNVAMSHGKTAFSCKGIQIAVEWFRARGHDNITVFIPQWRKEASRPDALITDQEILYDLEKQGIVVFTPARRVKGRRVVCYDDRFVLKLAAETDGIVVSNDVYRDLVHEREEFRQVVDHRLLMYSFVNDRFMPPEDPLGRMGPTLDDFLCKTPLQPQPKPQYCPYGKKCTYGNKCRFYHPERGFAPQKSITETLKEQAHVKLQERASKILEVAEKGKRHKQKLSRTKSMIPVEILSSLSLPTEGSEAKSKQGKPKFGHSKSLILPDKSSEYLNEPRRKLEEAELAAVVEQMVIDDLYSADKCSLKVFNSADPDKSLRSNSASPRTSPSHQNEALLQNAVVSDSQLNPTSPLNSLNTNSPQASSTLQNVASSDASERYISGHLLLAKKLSYENKESSFFADHVSSASSVQISSPPLLAGKSSELVQFPQKDFRTGQNINLNISSVSPQLYSFYKQQKPQQHQAYMPLSDQYPGLVSNASVGTHEVGTPIFRQKIDSGTISPGYRCEIIDGIKYNDYMDPRSPDSGVFTSTEGMTRSYPSHPEGHFQVQKSYLPSSTEDALIPQQQISLHRAYSSSDNVRTGGDLMALNQQYNMPVQQQSKTFQFGQSLGLSRQNSISDPQIHSSSGVGKFPDVLSSAYQDTCANNFDNYYSSQNQQYPMFQYFQQQNQQNYHQEQFNNHDLFKRQQQLQQHQMDSYQLIPQHTPKLSMDTWGQSVHSTNLDNIYSPGKSAARQDQYRSQQNAIFFQNTSHVPHFPATTATQSVLATAGPHVYSSSHNQDTSYYPKSPVLQPSLYGPLPTPTHSFSTGHHSHPIYPQHKNMPQNSYPQHKNMPQNSYPQHKHMPQNSTQSLQSAVKTQILNEDSPILPDDVRYTIYYHLSSVFGEQIVRKVLNLNPDILDPTQICQLLMKYKDTGS